MKRNLCLVLVMALSVSFFSGCEKTKTASSVYDPNLKVGDTGGLKLPLTDKEMKIEWLVVSSVDGLNDSYVVKKIRGMTGIDLQLVVVADSTLKEKIQTLIASGNLPDIIGEGIDENSAPDLCRQGAFAAVDDYKDELPNFKRTFVDNEKNKYIFKSYGVDGKLYGFYGYDWNRDLNTGIMMYRKDIFDKNGIKMWNSPETFYQTLKKLKELYPASTPYVSKQQSGIFKAWGCGWQIKPQDMTYDENTKKWFYTGTSDKYKEMLDFMKKLYSEKLIDPEFLTATQPDWTAKMTSEKKAFVTCDWIGRMSMFKEQTLETVPDYDLRFANPIGPDQTYPETDQLCWERYVKKSNKERELACFKLLDFILSPAGKELITMGVEGETYKLENGKAKYLEFGDKKPSSTDLQEKYGMFIEGMYLSFDRRSTYFNFTEAEQEVQDYAKDKNHLTPLDPKLSFTPEETTKKARLLAELIKAEEEFSVKYILSNASWEEWQKKAKSLGADELTKIYTEAQKRYDGA